MADTNDTLKEVTCRAQFKALGDGTSGLIIGLASTSGLDQVCDIVEPGAFKKSLARAKADNRKIPLMLEHWDGMIGTCEKFEQTDEGLEVEAQCNLEVQKGKETFALVKQGGYTGLSVRLYPTKVRFEEQTTGGVKNNVRIIEEAELKEVSVTWMPCNKECRITETKSEEPTPQTGEVDALKVLVDAAKSLEQQREISALGVFASANTDTNSKGA